MEFCRQKQIMCKQYCSIQDECQMPISCIAGVAKYDLLDTPKAVAKADGDKYSAVGGGAGQIQTGGGVMETLRNDYTMNTSYWKKRADVAEAELDSLKDWQTDVLSKMAEYAANSEQVREMRKIFELEAKK